MATRFRPQNEEQKNAEIEVNFQRSERSFRALGQINFNISLNLKKQKEVLTQSTIDLLCYITTTGHIAVTSLSHTIVSVFNPNENFALV